LLKMRLDSNSENAVRKESLSLPMLSNRTPAKQQTAQFK